jgi:transcriptional regulator with GAF, ATPase, and Fis domain
VTTNNLAPEDDVSANAAPLLGHGALMRRLLTDIGRVADTTATVLIRGESGVGKELVARAIHHASSRRALSLVKVNCAALPADLLESELFGHERGAFTGAYRRKPGKFELAAGGTIFLDEIGDLPLTLQSKLLHVLQDGEYARVGGSEMLRSRARIIAATNCDLEAAIRAGRFRPDLYYRLNVVTLRVPALRERRDEIPTLTALFLSRFNAEYGRHVTLGRASLQLLMEYDWPGNVRQLENVLRRIVVLQNEDLLVDELGTAVRNGPAPLVEAAWASEPPRRPGPLGRSSLRELARQAAVDAERQALVEVLERVRWNRAEAARLLGLSYKGFLYKLNRCGLGPKRAG